jgi:hypothetical protein
MRQALAGARGLHVTVSAGATLMHAGGQPGRVDGPAGRPALPEQGGRTEHGDVRGRVTQGGIQESGESFTGATPGRRGTPVTRATAGTMIAVPARMKRSIGSPRTSQPRKTATTGFTYA